MYGIIAHATHFVLLQCFNLCSLASFTLCNWLNINLSLINLGLIHQKQIVCYVLFLVLSFGSHLIDKG